MSTPSERAKQLLSSRQTLFLGTSSLKSNYTSIPTVSQAPFVQNGNKLYVYTSGLSQHTADMLSNPLASAMVVAGLKDSPNPFARVRITFTCKVSVVQRGTGLWFLIMSMFEAKFPKDKNGDDLFAQIRPLGDFILFELEPSEAVYVEDFGKAFRLDANLENQVHVRGTGPGAKVHEAPNEEEKK